MDYRYERYRQCLDILPEPLIPSTFRGKGILNSTINNLPFELHMPGYNYLGPGTKLAKKLEAGVQPANKLDALAMQHDIAYSKSNKLEDRHAADYALQEGAWNRVLSRDAGLGEKAVAWLTTNAMKAKRALGAGITIKHPISLAPPEKEKLAEAVEKQKAVTLKVSTVRTKDSVMNESYLPLTRAQIKNLKKNKCKSIRLSAKQVKKVKSGGYLKTILQTAPAVIGIVSSLMSAFKSKKQSSGKGLSKGRKKTSSTAKGKGVFINKKPKKGLGIPKRKKKKKTKGKGVYIGTKPKGKGVYINKKPKSGNGLLEQLLKKKKTLR